MFQIRTNMIQWVNLEAWWTTNAIYGQPFELNENIIPIIDVYTQCYFLVSPFSSLDIILVAEGYQQVLLVSSLITRPDTIISIRVVWDSSNFSPSIILISISRNPA